MMFRKRSHGRLYRAHETARMMELEGVELASFVSRACAFAIDFLAAAIVAVGGFAALVKMGAVAAAFRYFGVSGDGHRMLEVNFETWYGLLYLVAFFGLSVYIGNGRTLGSGCSASVWSPLFTPACLCGTRWSGRSATALPAWSWDSALSSTSSIPTAAPCTTGWRRRLSSATAERLFRRLLRGNLLRQPLTSVTEPRRLLSREGY